jgi:hypothetical protein
MVWLACGQAQAAPPPTSEFDSPYRLRVQSDGTVLEISGSFSRAVPQNLQAVLASEARRPAAGADHAAFCPSLSALVQDALALPDPDRVLALRTVLSSG